MKKMSIEVSKELLLSALQQSQSTKMVFERVQEKSATQRLIVERAYSAAGCTLTIEVDEATQPQGASE